MRPEEIQEELTRQQKFNNAVRTGDVKLFIANIAVTGFVGFVRSYATTNLPVDINSPINCNDSLADSDTDSDSDDENQNELKHPFCIAMEKGHSSILTELLKLPELNISNISDQEFTNSLIIAIEDKKWDVLKVLLHSVVFREKTAGTHKMKKLNTKNLGHVLVAEKQYELLKKWLEFCAAAFPEEVNSLDGSKNTLIHLLVKAYDENVALISQLIGQLIEISSFQSGIKNNKGNTALMLLARKTKLSLSPEMKSFIQKAVNSKLEGNLREVFISALNANNFILAKLLYDLDKESRAGFEIDLQKFIFENIKKPDALQKILGIFDPEFLSKLKFRVNGGDHNLVVAAAYHNETPTLNIILKSTIFPVSSAEVSLAIGNNSTEALALLFAHDYPPLDISDAEQLSEAEKQIYDEQLYIALLKAVDNKNPQVAIQKLYSALNTRQQNIFGEKKGTLLHIAAEVSSPEFFQIVTKENWSEEALNRVNSEERTALDIVISKKNSSAVKVLLSRGAIAMQDNAEQAIIDLLEPYKQEVDYKLLFLQMLLNVLNHSKLTLEKKEEKVTQILVKQSPLFLNTLQLHIKTIVPNSSSIPSISSEDKTLIENIIGEAVINNFDFDLTEDASSQVPSKSNSIVFEEEDLLSSVNDKDERESDVVLISSTDKITGNLGPNAVNSNASQGGGVSVGKGVRLLWEKLTTPTKAIVAPEPVSSTKENSLSNSGILVDIENDNGEIQEHERKRSSMDA